ncbi:VOC family protein [Microbacterium murale]|uniref:PhnB protein n=1 Tax=Microbacterium murale TaxID=1081040 RepID=A0ABU0P5A8_9MICO|nr:VOC family protein [Microbacterium murale]MDQ0642498.1 PhnB protein [Microbacterium murale]
MSGLVPYLFFPGNAREALTFYHEVFGGELSLFTYEQFSRTDGPSDAIAHGGISGNVELSGSDAGPDQDSVHIVGASFSLLGTAEPEVLQEWFAQLSVGGTAIDPLQKRPWGDFDGQVTDRYGIRWLIGYQE